MFKIESKDGTFTLTHKGRTVYTSTLEVAHGLLTAINDCLELAVTEMELIPGEAVLLSEEVPIEFCECIALPVLCETHSLACNAGEGVWYAVTYYSGSGEIGQTFSFDPEESKENVLRSIWEDLSETILMVRKV